jgi:hypothetical protein
MRIRITAGGIYGAGGELPVGTELDIAGPIPEGWAARCEVVQDAPAAPLTADTVPTMPLPTGKRGR